MLGAQRTPSTRATHRGRAVITRVTQQVVHFTSYARPASGGIALLAACSCIHDMLISHSEGLGPTPATVASACSVLGRSALAVV
ncbi:uncharacterized protein SCHCODRAFT_02049992 [Schizophyllum commune H4-8]|uniref:Expressed protein n=1 Tax=Schizophyllum commune (strain H4-8 / FGSC 9210) TaxID=578458 RepID=D8QEI3_SCHCM|nr:uncharacterized protein SCHCODRAFT_02049992 [Schizophyllum commune H4-8]KAI5888273.1 hypothetical protein SCHCODRAFT_02049992 [Schizophyllum commune H4-8]